MESKILSNRLKGGSTRTNKHKPKDGTFTLQSFVADIFNVQLGVPKPTIVKPSFSRDWQKLKSFRKSVLYSVDPKGFKLHSRSTTRFAFEGESYGSRV